MQKKILFNGLANVPSDRDCPEGQLAMAINLVNDNSGLEPAQAPETVFTIQGDASGMSVKGTHVVAGQKMYILADENTIGYYDPELVYHEIVSGIEDIQFIKPFGNALVVGTEGDLLYAMYKDGGYTWLGAMPELVGLSFGLEGRWINSGEPSNVAGDAWDSEGGYQSQYNDNVYALINTLVQTAKEDKKFIYPFMVRYAYRLYDGTHIKHSPPVLMVPNSGSTPMVLRKASVSTYDGRAEALACDLNYSVVGGTGISPDIITQLNDWSDIIAGIDVFVSAPFVLQDQNKDVDGPVRRVPSYFQNYAIASVNEVSLGYQRNTFESILIGKYPSAQYHYVYRIPEKADDVFLDEIKNCSLFYKLASLSIEDLSDTGRLSLRDKMSSDALTNLVNKQVLVDEYQSHHRTSGHYGYVYNSRLNIANIKQGLFDGFLLNVLSCYYGVSTRQFWANVYIKKEGRTIIVKTQQATSKELPLYFYYPDPDAYKAEIFLQIPGSSKHVLSVELKQHPGLNGAYYFEGFDPIISPPEASTEADASDDPFVSLPSKIITSDPLNPFFWPVEGVNTVGSGSILGMASATKALSQGQFGQFPLYVFTSEGVWAMQVSNTGLFASVHPVTRDILSTPGQILQMDNDIAFMTKKGIMVLGGSESVCITDILGSKEVFRRNTMSNIDNLVDNLGVRIFPASGINSLINGMVYGLSDILLSGILAYDYTNEKIYAFIPGTLYAFIFNKRSKEWTTAAMAGNVVDAVSDYPDSLVMLSNGRVVNICTKKATSDQKYFALITRPIKLAEAGSEALKKITRLIVRGTFSPEPGADTLPTVCCALYGTMDYKTYTPVASSINHVISSIRGKHYKAFRAVVVGRLFQGESLSGMDVDYEVKPAVKIE